MDKNSIKRLATELALIAVLIAVDQISKRLVDIYIPLGSTIPLWEGIFHLTSVHNEGAAFGMLAGSFWFLVVVRIIASLAMAFLLIKNVNKWPALLRVCLIVILAGAIGNLIDQIALGYVRDMFDFRLINFAVFNVADSYITVGTFFLALLVIFFPHKALEEQEKDS